MSSETHNLNFLRSLEYCLLSLLYLVRRSSILYVLEKKKFLSNLILTNSYDSVALVKMFVISTANRRIYAVTRLTRVEKLFHRGASVPKNIPRIMQQAAKNGNIKLKPKVGCFVGAI